MSEVNTPDRAPLSLRLVLIASLLLLLIATVSEVNRLPGNMESTPPPTDQSTIDTLIVPGTRIGPVTLGLSTKQMVDVLGQGQLRPKAPGTIHLYPQHGMVIYSEGDRVHSVTVRSPIYKTRSGVCVGSDVDQVLTTLGKNYEMDGSGKTYVLHNWLEGWHMEIADDRVSYIQVTMKVSEKDDL